MATEQRRATLEEERVAGVAVLSALDARDDALFAYATRRGLEIPATASTNEEWEAALKTAMEESRARYEATLKALLAAKHASIIAIAARIEEVRDGR